MSILKVFLILILLFLNTCSKDKKEVSIIKEDNQKLEMIASYYEGYDALEKGDTFFAAKKFLEAELLYPQSEWAPRAALLASYSYYLQNYYEKALSNLERFLIVYPNSESLVYAHYLIAMCYYENIEDEKRDQKPIIEAKEKFLYIIKNFPNTDFAIDAKFKIDLIDDILAAKEMYLGRHYIKNQKWIASINRFKNVLEKYEQTIYVEEAIHRLVEIYYKLGLNEESQKYANILGYNYQSSEWYKKTYKIFNKDYSIKINENINKNKKGVLDKFMKLFEKR